MKNIFSLVVFCLISCSIQAMDTSISISAFKNGEQAYAELYFHVIGNTVHYQTVDSMNIQSSIEVVILFQKEEQIVQADKYVIKSPLASTPLDFIDVKRYALPDDTYQVVVQIKDLNNETDVFEHKQELSLNFPKEKVGQSDIQFISRFEKAPIDSQSPLLKHGYLMEQMAFDFADKYTERLIFLNEIYHTDQHTSDGFKVTYQIETAPTSGKPITQIIGHKKRTAKPLDVVLLQVDITELETGNYNFIVEIRSKNDELLSKKVRFFQRSNPFYEATRQAVAKEDISDAFVKLMTEDELNYALKAIKPIVPQTDAETIAYIIKKGSVSAKEIYLFAHWTKTNANNPKKAYDEYMTVARAIDETFNEGFGFGFETDRGYTYMKHGQPNDRIVENNDPMAPPYEIWIYYDFPQTNQTNVKFIFYNPALEGDMIMLHSTARGEHNNPQWEAELYRDNPNELQGDNYIDGDQVKDGIYRNDRPYFGDN